MWAKILAFIKPYILKFFADKAKSAVEEKSFSFGRIFAWARNSITGRVYHATTGQSVFSRGNDLPGCRTDARNWAKKASSYGAITIERHNTTVAEVRAKIRTALDQLGPNKYVVIHYSSHGSQTADRDGDEADRKDEVILASDMGIILDDELFRMCDEAVRARGGNLVVILDTCHSGGMHRNPDAKPVFMHDARFMPADQIPEEAVKDAYFNHTKGLKAGEVKNFTVMMACGEQEYAYDGGAALGGAFTSELLRAIDKLGNATAWELFKEIRLPSERFPQTPQFAGRKDVRLFG